MTSKKYIIRPAHFRDAMSIYEVIRDNPQEVLPRSLPDIMLNFDRFWVYEKEGQVLGTISWRVLPVLNIASPELVMEIVSFSVRKDHQRQGIGKELLHTMIDHLAQYHPDSILVLTFYPEFFRKFGFTDTDKSALYPKIYLGCIECTKYPSLLTCPEVAMEFRLHGK